MTVGNSNSEAAGRRLVLIVVVAAVFMTNLDLWIVNVALPTISAGFSAGGQPPRLSSLSWVLNGYAVGLAALLVVAGRLGDRIGHRKVFLGGVLIFTVSSGLCALAPNLPIGVLSLIAGLRVLPHPPAREREPLPDVLGAALVTVAVASLTGALVQAPVWGWSSPPTLGLLLLAVLATALFLRRCALHPAPLFELSLFSVRGFGLANAAIFVFSVGFSIMLLSNVLWCQEVWHYSPLRTGFAMAPGPALVPVVTLLSARAVHRYGTAPVATAGSLLFAAGMLWQAVSLHAGVSYAADLLPSMVLGGSGVGLALSTLIAAGVTSLPAQRSATGSAVVNAGRQIAAAVGVAVLVSLLGVRVDAGSVSEFRTAWLVAAVLGLLAAGLAAAVPRPRPVLAAVPVPAVAGTGSTC